jgi:hypothetical protein
MNDSDSSPIEPKVYRTRGLMAHNYVHDIAVCNAIGRNGGKSIYVNYRLLKRRRVLQPRRRRPKLSCTEKDLLQHHPSYLC